MKLHRCNLVLAMGCMMLTVQASPPTAPDPSAQARAIGTPLKSSAPAISSKIRTCFKGTGRAPSPKVPAAASPAPVAEATANPATLVRLARVTAYWPGEVNGDYFTNCSLGSTGAHLQVGHCAVDPAVIPYGSIITIAGLGRYMAVDTGSAVVSRLAARGAAKTPEQQNALVVDLFFDNAADGEKFAARGPQYAAVTWVGSGLPDMTVDPQALERRKRFDKDTQDMVAWVQSPNPATAHDFASMDP